MFSFRHRSVASVQVKLARTSLPSAFAAIRRELDERVAYFEGKGQYLEAQRVRLRTNYDLEMLQEMGVLLLGGPGAAGREGTFLGGCFSTEVEKLS